MCLRLIFADVFPCPARGRRSPRGRRRQQGNGSLPDTDRLTDRDRLLTDHSATYRKYPGLNNVAYMSDPDLPPDHGSPSPNDEEFDHAPPPPPYVPPQPSIEEARQQMHSLLDDAFALVSPSSQGMNVSISKVWCMCVFQAGPGFGGICYCRAAAARVCLCQQGAV
uniref:Uncharacterized protein n=1 Tax=Hucho hucho TaxID=62062 RepID=A0A4W5NCT9_9TELE